MTVKPWTFFAVAIAGWMNRQQQQVIEYLRTENQILRAKLGTERALLNGSQKLHPASPSMRLGKNLGPCKVHSTPANTLRRRSR